MFFLALFVNIFVKVKYVKDTTLTQSLNMKKIIFLIAVIFTAISAYSQKAQVEKYIIIGNVIDSVSGKSVEYPTIAVFTDSLKLVNAVSGGADGKFSIEIGSKGDFVLSASMVGYTNFRKNVSIDGTQKRIDIGNAPIVEGVQIEEITVKGVKPLVVSETDKITYNLEADPQTQSSSIAEIMKKVPMLTVDGEDNVRLNGDTNFKVLVNGKSSGMLVKNFKDAIKAMPASSIKSIEVITNPPTKYDAEGVGGVINIITHKKTTNGYNGSLNAGANSLGGYNGGGYISAQTGKFAVSANAYYGKYISKAGSSYMETENFTSDAYRYTTNNGGSKFNSTFGNFSLEASYDIDSLNLITLSGWGYLGSSKSTGSSLYEAFDINQTLTRSYLNQTESKNQYGTGSGSLSYQRTFKKPDQTFTLSYNFDGNPSTSDYLNNVEGILDYDPYSQNSHNNAFGQEHTAQVDYYDPLTKMHQIEAGAKYTLRRNTSNTDVERFNSTTGQWENDNSRVNDLDYDQHIAGMYGGYVFKLKSLTAKAGFRAEYTYNKGLSKSSKSDVKFDNEQFNVVPYVNFAYQLKKGNNLSLSYTQRLNRPGIWYLNPYVNDSNPNNVNFGNPELESVIRNSVSFGYRKASQKWNVSANLMGNFSKNDIQSITRATPGGVSYTTYENIGQTQSVRVNANYSYRIDVKFNIGVNGSASYDVVKSKEMGLKNDGFSYNGSFYTSVALWKKANASFNIGVYGSPVTLQAKGTTNYYSSVGLSQKFLKEDKLTVSLYLNEPFEGRKSYTYRMSDPTYSSYSKSVYQNRQLNFSCYWRFGKFNAQVKKARRTSSDDKMGGGQSSGGAK